MRKAKVYRNGILAGVLEEINAGYRFTYDLAYFKDISKPPVSVTMPKNEMVYDSDCLFPFFFNMISEGSNRAVQSRQLRIDERDYFGLLLATAKTDTIGAITIKRIDKK